VGGAQGTVHNPRDKRLAMPTEDHPLDYFDFEGVIAEGQYGAGPVIVWDAGSYRNRTEQGGKLVPVELAVEDGHVAVWLEGRKLRGGYALTRIGKGKRERWLLGKMDDQEADARRKPVKSRPESVVSGRTVEEVVAEAEAGEGRRHEGSAGGASGAGPRAGRGGRAAVVDRPDAGHPHRPALLRPGLGLRAEV
jgi:ATP-dependent DNA ligase